MKKILADIRTFLTEPPNDAYDKSERVFRKYILISLVIHVVVISVFSISYSRTVRPEMPEGPFEVSLVQMERPKPAPKKPEPEKEPVKKPAPKKVVEKQKDVEPEEKKEEEVVKINPEVKKEEKKPEPEKKPAPKEEPPVQQPPEPPDEPAGETAEEEETEQASSVGGVQVDNPNFNFNYYLAMLRDKIQRNWKPPSGLPVKEEGISAVVRFTISRDGTISRADVSGSSGIRFFDQSALRAVVNSNPAPPLPRAYEENRLGVQVSFVFNEGTR